MKSSGSNGGFSLVAGLHNGSARGFITPECAGSNPAPAAHSVLVGSAGKKDWAPFSLTARKDGLPLGIFTAHLKTINMDTVQDFAAKQINWFLHENHKSIIRPIDFDEPIGMCLESKAEFDSVKLSQQLSAFLKTPVTVNFCDTILDIVTNYYTAFAEIKKSTHGKG